MSKKKVTSKKEPKYVVVVSISTNLFKTKEAAHAWAQKNQGAFVSHHVMEHDEIGN